VDGRAGGGTGAEAGETTISREIEAQIEQHIELAARQIEHLVDNHLDDIIDEVQHAIEKHAGKIEIKVQKVAVPRAAPGGRGCAP
jgi:predicted glycoside hydrolase/deacetylase ChbG (UPF0249 family)